jgi:hypothetical protein
MSDNQTAHLEKFLANEHISNSERSFGDSLVGSLKRFGRLSNRQWSAFQKMEARYSPEVIAQRKEWTNAWNSEKASNIKVAANYYRANPPYFANMVSKVLEDPKFVPSQKQYRAMVENKYVQKVLATIESEPLFAVGDLVQVRKTAKGGCWQLRNRNALVVANDGPVTSACKGARTYTILPFGESKTFDIQERWLKRKRG